jgi:signal transduction histidine kinase
MRLALTTDVSRLTTIVSSMLQLARLHSTELPFEPLQLNTTARAVLADLAPLILNNGADVALEEEGERRALIEANEPTVRARHRQPRRQCAATCAGEIDDPGQGDRRCRG